MCGLREGGHRPPIEIQVIRLDPVPEDDPFVHARSDRQGVWGPRCLPLGRSRWCGGNAARTHFSGASGDTWTSTGFARILTPGMDSKLLIDAIVQQTTVLIAQLSTAAGIQAPLAHVADQVFLDLARAIEAQGVSRKVVADMFGLAIRSYQKKMQRLTESQTDSGDTLWSAVLSFLQTESVTRARLLKRFERDPEREVLAVLNDLVSSGFVYSTGRGLKPVTASPVKPIAAHCSNPSSSTRWCTWFGSKYKTTNQRIGETILSRFNRNEQSAIQALDVLLSDGRVTETDGELTAQNFVVTLGAELGWEAAVLDHFQTVVRAIGAKLSRGRVSQQGDEVGGSTLSFSVYPGHPKEAEVSRLLTTVRALVLPIWEEVSQYNQLNPLPADVRKVSFYFGQTVESGDFGEKSKDAQ